jgi:hypothetical protein
MVTAKDVTVTAMDITAAAEMAIKAGAIMDA